MKLTMTLLLACLLCSGVQARSDTLLVVFWNLENFYEPDSASKPLSWTSRRYFAKCDAVAKTLMRIADSYGRIPDIVGFAEIESASVLRSILATTVLSKLNYACVHYDSPDHRNMDCALIYREHIVKLRDSFPAHIYEEDGGVMATRDILVANFDSLSVLVNHHPSKYGGGKVEARAAAMSRMEHLADSLLQCGSRAVLSMGDFNDELWAGESHGSIKYNGRWEKIDGHFSYGSLEVSEYVFADKYLMTRDKAYGGYKPLRCFSGPAFAGGVSDHLPIVLVISF